MKSLTQFITEELDTDNLFWLLDKWFERNEKQAQEFVEIIVKCKQDGQKVNIDNLKKYLKDNPPINEQMIKTMMMQMGRTPSQKQINQMMKAMNKNM